MTVLFDGPPWWRDVITSYGLDAELNETMRRGTPTLLARAAVHDVHGAGRTYCGLEVVSSDDDGCVGLGPDGVEFARLKSGVGEISGNGYVIVDAIARQVWLNGRELEWSAQVLVSVLTKIGPARMAIIAHGDGSHLDLGPVVVCGLYSEKEGMFVRAADHLRGLLRGCVLGKYCKRSRDTSTLIYANAIRARTAVLIVCKAGAIIDPAYPTNSNIAMSLLDGHLNVVIAPTGLTSVSPAVVAAVTELLAIDAPANEVRSVLDDISARGVSKFRVLGLPVRRHALDPLVTMDGGLTQNNARKLQLFEFSGAPRAMWRAMPSTQFHPGHTLAIGQRYCVAESGTVLEDLIEVADPAQHYAGLGMGQELHKLLRIECRLQVGLATLLESAEREGGDECRTLQRELSLVRRDCEQRIHWAFRRAAEAAEHGAVLPRWPGIGKHRVGRAFHSTAVKTLGHLARNEVDLFALVRAGLLPAATTRQDALPCELCGTPVHVRTVWELPERIPWTHEACRSCGDLKILPGDATPLEVHIHAQSSSVMVDAAAISETTLISAVATVSYKDHSIATSSITRSENGRRVNVKLDLATGASSQLHTARVIVMRDLDISAYRARVSDGEVLH